MRRAPCRCSPTSPSVSRSTSCSPRDASRPQRRRSPWRRSRRSRPTSTSVTRSHSPDRMAPRPSPSAASRSYPPARTTATRPAVGCCPRHSTSSSTGSVSTSASYRRRPGADLQALIDRFDARGLHVPQGRSSRRRNAPSCASFERCRCTSPPSSRSSASAPWPTRSHRPRGGDATMLRCCARSACAPAKVRRSCSPRPARSAWSGSSSGSHSGSCSVESCGAPLHSTRRSSSSFPTTGRWSP